MSWQKFDNGWDLDADIAHRILRFYGIKKILGEGIYVEKHDMGYDEGPAIVYDEGSYHIDLAEWGYVLVIENTTKESQCLHELEYDLAHYKIMSEGIAQWLS